MPQNKIDEILIAFGHYALMEAPKSGWDTGADEAKQALAEWILGLPELSPHFSNGVDTDQSKWAASGAETAIKAARKAIVKALILS